MGVGPGNTISGSVGEAASWLPKTNSSDRAAEWFTFLGGHFNTPMISLNSRPYSLPESLAG